jgi:hypothetical protein
MPPFGRVEGGQKPVEWTLESLYLNTPTQGLLNCLKHVLKIENKMLKYIQSQWTG